MCDEKLQLAIRNKFHLWVLQGRVFTAFDITQELRKALPNVNIYHRDVQDVIYQERSCPKLSSVWLAIPLMVDGKRVYANVYYPRGEQPEYHPLAENHIPNEHDMNDADDVIDDVLIAMDNVTGPEDSYIDSDDVIVFVMPTKENRVTIPMDIVREMGWGPGDPLEYMEFYTTAKDCGARYIRKRLLLSEYPNQERIYVNTDGRVRMTVPYNVMKVAIHKKNRQELQLTLLKK